MLEIWIEFAVVVEKLELWIVLLLRLKHDFHLCSLFADECRRLLDYRVYLHRPRLYPMQIVLSRLPGPVLTIFSPEGSELQDGV